MYVWVVCVCGGVSLYFQRYFLESRVGGHDVLLHCEDAVIHICLLAFNCGEYLAIVSPFAL